MAGATATGAVGLRTVESPPSSNPGYMSARPARGPVRIWCHPAGHQELHESAVEHGRMRPCLFERERMPRCGAGAAVERQDLKRPPVADVPPLGVPRTVVAKAPAGGGVSPSNVALMSS